jgi:DNA-binding MurR/RpiR family transcriptional regulator
MGDRGSGSGDVSEQQEFGLGPFDGEFAGRVAEARGNLSSADQQILAYLTDNPDGLAFHTAESLSAKAGVSRAAVVRFAKRLGYTGFTDFRTAARDAMMTSQESPLSRFSQAEPDTLVERKALQDTRNILAAAGLVRDALAPAAQAVARARRVLIMGMRMSYGLAAHLHRLLNEIRDGVTLIDPGFPDQVIGACSRDIVIVFLFRRYSRLTVDLLADVANSGAPVVLITDGRGHPWAAAAQHVLVAPVDGPALYDSMVAPMWILESLAAEVAAVRPKQSRARLEAVERFTKDHRLLS